MRALSDLTISRRLHRIIDSYIPGQHSRTLARIPRFAGWGPARTDKYLSIRNEPVRICVVGIVVDIRVVPYSHSVSGRAGVELELLRDVDHAGMVRLLRLAEPIPCTCAYPFPTPGALNVSHSDISAQSIRLQVRRPANGT